MNEEPNKRLVTFLKAIETAGIRSAGKEVACHHSAVEVNDWHKIQKAMRDSINTSGSNDSSEVHVIQSAALKNKE